MMTVNPFFSTIFKSPTYTVSGEKKVITLPLSPHLISPYLDMYLVAQDCSSQDHSFGTSLELFAH